MLTPQSEIPDTSPNEDFNVSLGADQAIRISSQPIAVLRGSSGKYPVLLHVNKVAILLSTACFSIILEFSLKTMYELLSFKTLWVF